jgi:hypothetical protein
MLIGAVSACLSAFDVVDAGVELCENIAQLAAHEVAGGDLAECDAQ